ncbi:MAG: LamG domain-containing protein [Lentisphaerae bacterium]|nr:LamG domain-containing protein [Lentisphaerota bacterium]
MKKMNVAKICSIAVIAAALSGAGAAEELLYFPFDENINAETAAKSCSVVGHIGSTTGNGGFSGEALDIKPGLNIGYNGMEMPFRALTVKPAQHHDPEKGAIEFYVAASMNDAEKKQVEAGKAAPFAWLFNLARYDEFRQEGSSLNIRFGYIYQKGKRGKQWRLIIVESAKKEKRVYKTTYDWTQCMNENIFGVDAADWKPGQWHHVVFSWEGKNRKFYVDGKLIREVKDSVVYPMIAKADSMVFCGRAPFQHHHPQVSCRMDEFKIYDAPIVPAAKENK